MCTVLSKATAWLRTWDLLHVITLHCHGSISSHIRWLPGTSSAGDDYSRQAPSKLHREVTLMTYIRKTPGSKLGQGTDLQWGVWWFSSDPPNVLIVPPSGHERFLPNPLQCITKHHTTLRVHWIAWDTDSIVRSTVTSFIYMYPTNDQSLILGHRRTNRRVDMVSTWGGPFTS
jgi:hypothetical protein